MVHNKEWGFIDRRCQINVVDNAEVPNVIREEELLFKEVCPLERSLRGLPVITTD